MTEETQQIQIPEQLRSNKFRFVPITRIDLDTEGRKNVKGLPKDWPNTANCGWDEITTQDYGVLCNGELVVVDIDTTSADFKEVVKALETLPKTFTVRTWSGGIHKYFFIPEMPGRRLTNQAGEIRSGGMFVIGPGSVVSDKRYEVIENLPITKITKEELEKVLTKWLKPAWKQVSQANKLTDKTRSGVNWHNVCKYIKQGLSKEQIFSKMHNEPKWKEAPQSYRETTFANALLAVEVERQPSPELVEELFGKPKKQKARLGQGLANEKFFYGTEIEKEGNCYSTVICSDRQGNPGFLVGWSDQNQIEKELEISYKSEFDDEACSFPWRNRAIKNYLGKDYKQVNLADLIEKQSKLWQKFVFFEDEREYWLQSCFATNTYAHSLFNYQPRIDFRGQTDSGKSTASKIHKLTAFNTIWLNKGTDAARFRDLDITAGTLIVDNYDSLPLETKTETNYFIEVSFERESANKRIAEAAGRNKWKTRSFHAYCPMVINSKLGYGEDSTVNRLITTVMGKKRNMPKLDTKLPDWQHIREENRLFVLDNWPKIEETYEKLSIPFTTRAEDIYKPILTIAKLADNDIYKKVEGLLKEKAKWVELTQGEDDFERTVLHLLLKQIGQNNDIKIASADLGELLITAHWGYQKEDTFGDTTKPNKQFLSKKKYAGTVVKNVLKNIPATSKPGRITWPGNRQTFHLTKKEIEDFMLARGLLAGVQNRLV